MLQKPGVLTEAEYKEMFRKLYKEQGFATCMQCVYEFLMAAQWMSEIMKEEMRTEDYCSCPMNCQVHQPENKK